LAAFAWLGADWCLFPGKFACFAKIAHGDRLPTNLFDRLLNLFAVDFGAIRSFGS